MSAVKNNPFRTLGLFGNSKEKELQRQLSKLKAYTSTGKEVHFDYDFPFFGEVVRNIEKVQEAASKIEQAKNKVHYALFWFLNSGHIDEVALNNLKDGYIEKATEIWEKTLKDSKVTAKNFAAINNLSTLQLGIVTYNGSFDPEKFTTSIELKGKLIMSDAFESFITTVIGEGISINRDTILKEFADEIMQIIKPFLLKPKPDKKTGLIDGVMENGIGLYRWDNGDLYYGEWKDGKRTGFGAYIWGSGHSFTGHFNFGECHGEGVYHYPNGEKKIGEWKDGEYQVNQNYNSDEIQRKIKNRFIELKIKSGIPFNCITVVQFINSFRSFPNEIRQYVTGKFIDRSINKIENQIENTKQKREDYPYDAEEYGEELYENTKDDLAYLKRVLGAKNVQYQMIANKLANEILQCAIDFFVEHRDSSEFDPGESAMDVMEMAKAINPTGQISSRVDENIENLQGWIDDSSERIKQNLIKQDFDFIIDKLNNFQKMPDTIPNAKYLILSCKQKLNNIRAVLGATDNIYLDISSAVVNNALNAIIEVVNVSQSGLQYDRAKFLALPSIITSAVEALNLMVEMDMFYELRNRFNQNKATILNTQTQLYQVTQRQSSSSSSSGGCYIATMAYGSYKHPQVLELRKYRDKTLSKSSIGRGFIRAYYKYSPKLVEHLKDKPLVNKIIKSILNTLIRIIK